MKRKNPLFIFILLSLVFTGIVFLGKNYFLSGVKNSIEEQYIEESLQIQDEEHIFLDAGKEKKHQIIFSYFPSSFKKSSQEHRKILNNTLNSESFVSKVANLRIHFFKDLYDVRGRMKYATVKLYGVLDMGKDEFLSVSIHEVAHYIDLYYLNKKVFKDISYDFYDISWESTKVLRAGQKQEDFVSGYSMSNKYEDFAESFTYYVLHNGDFKEKAKKSSLLQKKYDYFSTYIFKNKGFKETNFSTINKIENYYRDITKIPLDLENFLQYIKK